MSGLAISTEPPVKRRRRPPLACEQCRKRKIRCDRNIPCNHCTRSNASSCSYAPAHIPKHRRDKTSDTSEVAVLSRPSSTRIRSSAVASLVGTPASESFTPSSILRQVAGGIPSLPTPDASSAASDRASLLARINQLERRLSAAQRDKGGSEPAEPQLFCSGFQPIATKGCVSKTRYFGQSHWMNGAALFPVELALLGREEQQKGELYQRLSMCKILGRKIKIGRLRPLSSLNLCRTIPALEVVDGLVEAYLRTFEGVFRILHVPTFRAEYERYRQNPSAANEAFVIVLQLCMALGTLFHDDPLSMRSMASGWIYEAKMWLMMPPEKGRMTLVGIQIMCLLVLAKSVCGVGQDLTWVMAGSLVRNALYMGLHRDPKHLVEMTSYRAEMRRRLWATILELNLQCSFESGGLPLISPDEYDTLPPSNLDDEQLTDDPDGSFTAPMDRPTQTLVQIELLKSLPVRSRLLQHVNSFRSGENYEETLRLNSDLARACREFNKKISPGMISSSTGCVGSFHVSLAEVFLYRCFQTLHLPIMCKSFEDPRYYFSRKMSLDSALKLTDLWGLRNGHRMGPVTDFRRAVTNGSGIFRNIPVQSVFVLSLELTQELMGNSTGLGYLPSVGEADIQSCLREALEWTFDRVRAGEVSAKGACFLSGCLAHAEALERSLNKSDTEALILQRATESAGKSWEELRAVARRLGIAADEDDGARLNLETQGSSVDAVAEWDNGWAWDEAEGLTWAGPWSQLQMPLDEDLNKFFGNYT